MEGAAVRRVLDQREILQDLRTLERMGFHLGIFVIGQFGRLVQNVVGNGNFPDVMQPGRPFHLIAFFLVQPVGLRDGAGILRHAAAVLAGPDILGVHRAGNRHHGLFAHLRLAVRRFQLRRHPPLSPGHQQSGDPDDGKDRHGEDIEDKPVVIVKLLFFDQIVGPFRQHVLPVAVIHGQMEGVFSCRQIGIGDRVQAVLRHNGPFGIEALQIIADIRLLDRVVDNLRIQFQPADAPGHPDRAVALHPPGHSVHSDRPDVHPVGDGIGAVPVGIDHKHAGVTGQIQFARLLAEPAPAVGCQTAVQSLPGVQQIVGNSVLAAQQLAAVHHIDSGAGHDVKRVHSPDPDIIVVEIGEIVQRTDRIVRIHIAQPVAGHHKDAPGLGIPDGAQNHLRAQTVRAGQHPYHLPVLNDGDSVAVRSGQNPSVFQFRQRQDHGADLSFGIQDRILYPVIPDEADSRISRRQDRPVPQLSNGPGPAAEAPVVPVIPVLRPVRFNLQQAVAVQADPQVILIIHVQAADALSGQRLRPAVEKLLRSVQVHNIQSQIRSDIVSSLPLRHGIHDPVLHPGRTVDIAEFRGGQP